MQWRGRRIDILENHRTVVELVRLEQNLETHVGHLVDADLLAVRPPILYPTWHRVSVAQTSEETLPNDIGCFLS